MKLSHQDILLCGSNLMRIATCHYLSVFRLIRNAEICWVSRIWLEIVRAALVTCRDQVDIDMINARNSPTGSAP